MRLPLLCIAIFITGFATPAVAQDLSPISIQVGNIHRQDVAGKMLLEINNNTSSELLIPTEYVLAGQVMLSTEDSKAKKGLQTSVSFFASRISNSSPKYYEDGPNHSLGEMITIAPNSGVKLTLDLSKLLERARGKLPDEPINLRIDFTQSFAKLKELKDIVGLKVRSKLFVFEKSAPFAN